MDEKRSIETAAYHEAGHAIMSLWWRLAVREVVLNQDGTGHCGHEWNGIDYRNLPNFSDKTSHEQLCFLFKVIAEVCILLAGPVAEEALTYHDKYDSTYGGSHDLDVVAEILNNPVIEFLFEKYAPNNAYDLGVIDNEVCEWVKEPHVVNAIQVLAEELMIKTSIQGAEVVNLLIDSKSLAAKQLQFNWH